MLTSKDIFSILDLDTGYLPKRNIVVNSMFWGDGSSIKKDSILIFDPYFQSKSLKDVKSCILFTQKSNLPEITYDGRNLIIPVKSVHEVFNIFAQNFEVNIPSNFDENKLRYFKLESTHVYRTIVNNNVSFGYDSRVGITNDIIFEDSSNHLETLSGIGGVSIGDNVIIGSKVIIYRGITELTVIEDNVVIQDFSIIHAGAKIKSGSIIKSFSEIW